MSNTLTIERNETLSDQSELAHLLDRLERGFEILEEARSAGRQMTTWEDEWLRLLRQYELLVDQIAA